VAACGAFLPEHHEHAAKAGLCCVDLAFHDIGDDPADTPTPGPTWPPFNPDDTDIPGGPW
jgi:hypothetical protein